MGNELGAAGKRGLSRGEIEQDRGQAIDFQVGIVIEEGHDAVGFAIV